MTIPLEQFKLSPQEQQQKLREVPLEQFSTQQPVQEKESLLNKIGSIAGLDVLGKKIGYGLARLDPLVRQYPESIADDPTWGQTAGAGLKLASTLIPAGKLVKGGLALKGAISGGIFGTGQAMTEKKNLVDTATTAGEYALGGAVMGKALSFLPKGLKNAGIKTTGVGMTQTEGEKLAMLKYDASKPTLIQRVASLFTGKKVVPMTKPTTTAETVAKLILPGTERGLGVSAERVQPKLWKEIISPALKSTKDKVDMKQFFAELQNKIIKENPDLARKNTLLTGLKSLKEDFKNVSKIGYEKLQDYKSGWSKFIPEKAYAGHPITGALNEVRNMASSKARQMIYDKLGVTTKQAYLDYGNLNNIIKEATTGNPAIDKTSLFRGAWQFIADRALTPVTSFSGKILYKTGQGLEFIGDVGMRNLGDILGIIKK